MPYADPAAQSRYQREWMAQRRDGWFADKVCAWCGDPDDLELDHLDSAEKVSHRIWSWSRERREAELERCQPLCHYCHKLKTQLLGENPSQINSFRHGSRSMYDKHECRCDVCRAGHAAQRRARRRRQKIREGR